MNTIKCEICGKEIPQDEAYEVGENSGVFVCQECFVNECVECERCGEIMFYDDANHTRRYGYLCDCCYDELFG